MCNPDALCVCRVCKAVKTHDRSYNYEARDLTVVRRTFHPVIAVHLHKLSALF